MIVLFKMLINQGNNSHFHYPGPPQIHIQLDDLKDVYDKVQIKKLPCSEQRIAKGKVNGVAWTEGQIKSIRAFVERTPEAAGKVSDRIHVGKYISESDSPDTWSRLHYRIHRFENVKVALQNHNIATFFNQFDILKQRVASLLMKTIFFMASEHTPQ